MITNVTCGAQHHTARSLYTSHANTHTICPMRNPDWHWDELLLACALVVENDWHDLREPDLAVQDLSDLLQVLPLHPIEGRGERFRSPGSVSRKTSDLATAHPSYQGRPTRGGRLDKEVVSAFCSRPREMLAAADAIRHAAVAGELHARELEGAISDELGFVAPEGRLLAGLHFRRERDPRLRTRMLAAVRGAGRAFACEVCTFDFSVTYGSLGQGYIEVHHVVPLHVSGPTETSLGDLALLCANCHRMCHRAPSRQAPWRTPHELRQLMRSAH